MRRLHREIIDYGLLKRRWTIGPIKIRQHRCLDADCAEYNGDIGQPIVGRSFVPLRPQHTLVLGRRLKKQKFVGGGDYEFLGYNVRQAMCHATFYLEKASNRH